MLIRLLRSHLRRYRGLLVGVGILQFVQAMASLFLPTLNADIIDKGVARRHGLHLAHGRRHARRHARPGCLRGRATFCGARAAMGFGRDVRGDLFHTVIDFSAREVGQFGAPSLITRITNDVQQVQILVLMSCTLLVTAPITIVGGTILAIREDGSLSLLLFVSIPVLLVSVGRIALRMHPQFTKMQERIDRVNQVLREQITGIRVVRAFVREPDETGASGGPTPISPRRRCAPAG